MNKDKLSNILFISLFIIFWGIISIYLIKNSNEFNLVDNRSSYKFEKININKILSGDYQDNIEKSISDQMPKYNYFQLLYPKISNYINYSSINNLKLNNSYKYINLGNVYLYNDYLLYKSITDDDLKIYDKYINKINYVIDNSNSNIYLYYINGDTNIDFSNNKIIDVDNYLKNRINNSNYDSLKVNTFDDYKKYYYRLDHHLNNVGTDKVYNDILKLMNLNNKLNKNNETCFNNKKVLGSKSKAIALNSTLKEKMCFYNYNYPEYTIYLNGVEGEYGNNIDSLNNMDEISYSTIYGSDYSEIIFINNNINSNKNLLIYSNSYSNSLNKLLGSHYKNTYVIDGRYNKDFNMVDYINKNNIDDVLILSSKMLFFDDIEWGDF